MEFETDRIVALLESMERNYSLRPRHPEREEIYASYAQRSEQFRAASPGWRSLSYAAAERCAIDWFPAHTATSPDAAGTPLLVFIHGGFWRALDRRLFSFIAEQYVSAGVSVAMLGYELAPAVKLGRIVEQAADAMRWLNQRASDLGFDPRRVVVAGHSAGGHLAALLAATEPEQLHGFPLAGVVPISGVFALAPLLLTSVNHDVRMTPDEALRLSPAGMSVFHAHQFLVAVGEYETEGFIGQSQDFVRAAQSAGCAASLHMIPKRTHFDILEDLAQPEFDLFQRVLQLLRTSPASA